MRMLVAGGVMALACTCAPTWCWAGDTASDNADKAGQVDAYARDQLGIGIDELAWLIEAACDGSVYSTRGITFIARKPALDRLAQKGFVKLVEFGSPEFVAVCPTPKGVAVQARLLSASR
jgi:hypothetical protein